MNDGVTLDQTPIDPKRVRAFAEFFKRYMSISSLVVASLPIPVTSLGLIPTFNVQTKLLSVYTSLFCFLTLGFIFYSRHQLARLMFPEYFSSDDWEPLDLSGYAIHSDMTKEQYEEVLNRQDAKTEKVSRQLKRRKTIKNMWRRFIVILPLLFIAASLVSVFQYNDVLILNVREIAYRPANERAIEERTFKNILEKTDLNDIKYSSRLMILYVAIFLTAEAAFIMMAIKEYLQDLAGLTEMDLIRGKVVFERDVASSTPSISPFEPTSAQDSQYVSTDAD